MKKLTAIILALLLILTLGACGGDSDTGGGDDSAGGDVSASAVYTVDEVKAALAGLMEIDESEFTTDERDTGTVVSFGDFQTMFDTYIMNDPADAPDMFNIQIWDDVDYDKRIDNDNHRIWIEESDTSSAEYGFYTVVAMKGNMVIGITSVLEPDAVIDALDLD
jgi:hypothetical protein